MKLFMSLFSHPDRKQKNPFFLKRSFEPRGGGKFLKVRSLKRMKEKASFQSHIMNAESSI